MSIELAVHRVVSISTTDTFYPGDECCHAFTSRRIIATDDDGAEVNFLLYLTPELLEAEKTEAIEVALNEAEDAERQAVEA